MKTQKILTVGTAIVSLIIAGGVMIVDSERSANATPPNLDNPVFSDKVTGTWVEAGPGFSTILNIETDGTLGWFGSWFFGDGTGNFKDGPVYGSWRQIGALKAETTEVGHLFNGDGSFFATGRVKQIYEFSPDFKRFTYSGSEDIFLPDQDPTDPNEEPAFSFEFSGGPFRRLGFMN